MALKRWQKVLISIPLDIVAFVAGLWLFRKVMNLLKGKKAKK